MVRDRVEFGQDLALYHQELKEGRRVPEHEESYAYFFTCNQTPTRGAADRVQLGGSYCSEKTICGVQCHPDHEIQGSAGGTGYLPGERCC